MYKRKIKNSPPLIRKAEKEIRDKIKSDKKVPKGMKLGVYAVLTDNYEYVELRPFITDNLNPSLREMAFPSRSNK